MYCADRKWTSEVQYWCPGGGGERESGKSLLWYSRSTRADKRLVAQSSHISMMQGRTVQRSAGELKYGAESIIGGQPSRHVSCFLGLGTSRSDYRATANLTRQL